MFEKTAYDGGDSDIVADARHTGTQAADTADDEPDAHASHGRTVQLLDDFLVHELIALQDDLAAALFFVQFHFLLDVADESVAHAHGGNKQRTVFLAYGVTGHDIEEIRDVLAHVLIGRENPHVRIDLGSGGVVVARAHMSVAHNALLFPAHHKTQLGVNFHAHNTVDHIHARLFKFLGPRNVALLIETGLEFHHGRHLLAAPAGLDKGLHDWRVVAAAVKRLLDGDDAGIDGSVVHKVEYRFEAVIRMMHEKIAVTDALKNGVAVFREHGRDAAGMRRYLERGTIHAVQGHQGGKRQRSLHAVDLEGTQMEFLHQEFGKLGRHAVCRLEADHVAETALIHEIFHGFKQIIGLVLFNFQVRIAGDAEETHILDGVPREQRRQVFLHQLFHKQNIRVLCAR